MFVSGLLAEAEVLARDPGAQTRDIIRKLGAVLQKADVAPRDVRDLLVYVTDAEAGRAAMDGCREAFATTPSISLVPVRLAAAGARVEIMAYAEK